VQSALAKKCSRVATDGLFARPAAVKFLFLPLSRAKVCR
jgi:hypothetical protein